MARSRPKWFDAALAAILAGDSIADAARAAGCRRETVSRAMRDPQHPFSKELAQLRAAAASSATPGELVQKATAVLEQHLDSGDARSALDAAKVVVGKLAAQQPAEPEPVAEEVTPEQAIREMIATLPTLPVLLREGQVPPDLVDELRRALAVATSTCCRAIETPVTRLSQPQGGRGEHEAPQRRASGESPP